MRAEEQSRIISSNEEFGSLHIQCTGTRFHGGSPIHIKNVRHPLHTKPRSKKLRNTKYKAILLFEISQKLSKNEIEIESTQNNTQRWNTRTKIILASQ